MIQVHTGGLQTVIPLLIHGVTSILHTFSILSAPSMYKSFKTLINCLNRLSRWYSFIQSGCKQLFDLVDDIGSYSRAANSYPPAYRGCHINTEHIFNYISAIYDWIFKTLIYCLNLLSRWCRFIQAGWKQLFPCLSGMSHQYCKYFQFYQGHLWLNSLKLWDRGLKFS